LNGDKRKRLIKGKIRLYLGSVSWMGREGKYGVEGQGQEGPECCEVVRADLGETWEVNNGILWEGAISKRREQANAGEGGRGEQE